MKASMLLSALILLSLGLSAQVTVDWYHFTGGAGIATDQQNNVYTAYSDYNPAGDIYVIKRDALGNQLWQVSYNQTDNTKWDNATWVETDPQGNVIVSGTLMSGYSNPVNAASILMKFSPQGNLLWRKVYETSFDGSSTRKCLVDAAGNIYVVGLGMGPNGLVTKVKKFDPNGNALWNYFNQAGIGAPINMKFTPDSNLLIIARGTVGSINGYAKISRSGNEIWSLAGVQSLIAGDAAGDAQGNTYVLHGIYSSSGGNTLKKLNPNGVQVWSRDYASLSMMRVEVGTDNQPVLGGYPNSGTFGAAFLKTDINGNVLWTNLDADGPSYMFLSHAQMKLDGQNNVYLAASIMTEMGMVKVSSQGTTVWVKTFPTGYSQAFSIGTDNNIYVVGGTTARLGQGTTPPPCGTPLNTISSQVNTVSALLSWSAVPGATGYLVRYRITGSPNWILVNSTTNSLALTGLVSFSTYEWQAQAICTGTTSAFSTLATFRTVIPVCTDPFEPNNSIGNASPVPLNSSLNGLISSAPDADWFRINTVSPATNIRIELSNLPADYDMRLYAANGRQQLGASLNAGNMNELIVRNSNNATTYYLKVFGKSGAFNPTVCYNLRINSSSTRYSLGADPVSGRTINEDLQVQTDSWLVYPNPVRDRIVVDFNSPQAGKINWTIYSITGKRLQLIVSYPVQGHNRQVISVAGLPSGTYILEKRDGDKTDRQLIQVIK